MLRAYESETLLKCADGISPLFDSSQFERKIIKPFVLAVLERYAHAAAEGQLVCEKTPSNIRYHALIHRLFPQARMIEVVRDPRAVVASWLAAGKEDWGRWAKMSEVEIARRWVQAVEAGCSARKVFGEKFYTIQYEHLHAEPLKVIGDLANWLGIGLSGEQLFAVAEATDFSRAQEALFQTNGETRVNFFRQGLTDAWERELSPEQVASVNTICAENMARFGYLAV
jgi:hypothetical protein